jgi:hypothetical protein
MTPRFGALLAFVLVAATACSSGSTAPASTTTGTTGGTTTTPVATVTLSPTGCTLNPAGSCVLTATTKDASGNALSGRTVTWSSATTTVATVSTSGTVTAVAAGSSVITATSEGKTATVTITVTSTASSTVLVTVDASSSAGAIADLFGVNRKPTAAPQSGGTSWDGTTLYTAFGISQVRVHGGGMDICGTYTAATKINVSTGAAVGLGCTVTPSGGLPHMKWTPTSSLDADLNNTANYDFTSVDEAVSAVLATGGKLYFRLADAFNGFNDTDDPVAVAKVATNIYKHVIGQFKPSSVTADPSVVELWNEPDGGFWQGNTSTFDSLYVQMATRVRAAAAAAGKSPLIGGAGFTQNVVAKSAISTNPAYNFVSTVGASNVDFYSAHWYGTCSTSVLPAAAAFFRNVRALADAQGATGKPMHITEWNIGLGQSCGEAQYAEQRMTSYASAILTLMQDPAQKITAAHYYAGMPLMSLFDWTSASGKVRINPGAWAFWAHSRLKGSTMLTAQICPGGTGCGNGYAAESKPLLVMAGTASGVRNIVITNDGSSAVTYTLRVSGLTGSTVTATVYTPPSATTDVTVTGSPLKPDAAAITALMALPSADVRSALGVTSGQIEMTLTVPANSVQVVKVQ